MLERGQLALADLVDDAPDTLLGHDIGLDDGDAIAGAGVAEQLLGRLLVADNSEDVELGAERGEDGRGTDVARGTDDENGRHAGRWLW